MSSRKLAAFPALIISATCAAGPDVDQFSPIYLDANGRKIDGIEATRPSPVTRVNDRSLFSIVAQNNLCASLLKIRQIKSAERACREAKRLALAEHRRDAADSTAIQGDWLAAIHSNLGIVNVALGDHGCTHGCGR